VKNGQLHGGVRNHVCNMPDWISQEQR